MERISAASGLCAWVVAFAILNAAGTFAAPAKSTPQKARIPKSQSAAPATKSRLDTSAVRKYYLDGEFDPAIAILETGLKEKRSYNHQDSIFIFKHLGVMYAAKYETRERGRYYMHQLLMTEPTAKILDMYASEMIYMIFKNIQDEFESNRKGVVELEDKPGPEGTPVVGTNTVVPSPTQPKPVKPHNEPVPKKSGHTLLWVGATGVVVAGAVAAFFLLSEKPTVKSDTTDHPVN